mgnify:CR=1 FL=1
MRMTIFKQIANELNAHFMTIGSIQDRQRSTFSGGDSWRRSGATPKHCRRVTPKRDRYSKQ